MSFLIFKSIPTHEIFICFRNLIWEHVLNLFLTLIKDILHFKNVNKISISFFDSISIHKNVYKKNDFLWSE